MRIVLFGSGSLISVAALAALSTHHDVVAAILPAAGSFRNNPLARAAADRGVAVEKFGTSLGNRLRAISPDLLCAATFPHKIAAAHLAAARLGGLNVHPSLLPKHRGPDPLFWTYFDDDDSAGVSIHYLGDEIDAGDIVAQSSISLTRGRCVTDLYTELAALAGKTLAEAVMSIELGTARPRSQDPSAVTSDPRPLPGAFAIDFETWGAERVWHFLRGIGERRGDLLPVPHGHALAYEVETHDRKPGSIATEKGHLRVFCRDGWVDVARPSVSRRMTMLLRRVRSKFRPLY